MNQIAAAILVLSASICGYAASVRPNTDGFGGIMSLIALGLGLWGGLGLLAAVTTEREYHLLDDDDIEPAPVRRPPLGLTRFRSNVVSSRIPTTTESILGSASRDYRLSPETNAQVSMAAEVNGRSRHDIVEDILQKNLPRYSSRVA